MSNHTTALVPIEVWQYASPDLSHFKPNIDIGLFAEALVYYEHLWVNAGNQSQFALFVSWFVKKKLLGRLLQLIQDDVVKFYNYNFYTLPKVGDKIVDLFNIVEQKANEQTFAQHYLEKPEVISAFSDAKSYEDFCRAINDKVVQANVADFESAIENARADFINPQRHTLLLQSLIDELYLVKNLGTPPKVQTTIITDGFGRPQVRVDLDLDEMAKLLGVKGVDYRVSPGEALSGLAFSGAGKANNLIVSAMKSGIDLYLPRPLSLITGDKLYEADMESTAKSHHTIQVLQEKVNFPDLRKLVNGGEIEFEEILNIRREAKRIRKWLQDGAEQDKDLVTAYHHEVTKAVGFTKYFGKTLEIFGKFSNTIGGAVGVISMPDNPIAGALIGGLVGDKLSFVGEVGNKMTNDWKPLVFGTWLTDRVNKIKSDNEGEKIAFNPLGINRAMRQAEEVRMRRARNRLRQIRSQ
jgi:hypothetical protein